MRRCSCERVKDPAYNDKARNRAQPANRPAPRLKGETRTSGQTRPIQRMSKASNKSKTSLSTRENPETTPPPSKNPVAHAYLDVTHTTATVHCSFAPMFHRHDTTSGRYQNTS